MADKVTLKLYFLLLNLSQIQNTHTHTHTCIHITLSQLVHVYGFDASLLPSRGLLSRFSRPKKAQLEEMQGKLEEMLMTVVQKFEVPPMELLKFVEYPFTVSRLHAGINQYL